MNSRENWMNSDKPNFFLDVVFYISFYFVSLFVLIELFKPYVVYWSVCVILLFSSLIVSLILAIIVETNTTQDYNK